MIKIENINLGIIGLGYVGLPLALKFASKRPVIAYDLNKSRIDQLKKKIDYTNESNKADFDKGKNIVFTSNINDLKKCNCYIIAVPTPVNKKNLPDLNNLIASTTSVAQIIKKNDIIIYESTVYPGATREVCVPILEKISNFKLNKEFFVGYSPERINPGDKVYTLENIIKITSGSDQKSGKVIDDLYRSIVKAGTFRVESIEVAEAAKVIENTQRDLNIALINELSIIFNKMKLDTDEILKAAGSKWNFLHFKPGLVGGHCIGVDPYYLTYKSKKIGYKPKIILAGRHLNDSMSIYISKKIIEKMNEKKIKIKNAKILIMGISFKENCSDIRNSKVLDLVRILRKKNMIIDIYDPVVSQASPEKSLKAKLINFPKKNSYDCIILSVPHTKFLKIGVLKIKSWLKENNAFFDLKSVYPKNYSDFRL